MIDTLIIGLVLTLVNIADRHWLYKHQPKNNCSVHEYAGETSENRKPTVLERIQEARRPDSDPVKHESREPRYPEGL